MINSLPQGQVKISNYLTMMSIKTLITDDHQLVREGVRLMIDAREGISVIGEAVNGQEAIDFVENNEVDVVLLDLNMPEVNGIEACKTIKKIKPNTKVIILSMISETKLVKNLMKYGANGYLLKNSGQDEILSAIIDVHGGENHFDQEIINMLLDPDKHREVKDENLHPSLSRREKEILELIIDEHTTAEIAKKLFISFGTVESHRRNMISKLGVRNTAGLVSAAYKYGLLD